MRAGRMRRTQKTKHRHEGMTSGIPVGEPLLNQALEP